MLSGTAIWKRKQQLHQVDYTNFALFSQNKDPEFWVLGGQEERRRRKIFVEGKYLIGDEKKMGGIYGEGNYFLEEKKKREGKGGKILEKENMYLMSRKTEKRKGEIFDEQNYVFGG